MSARRIFWIVLGITILVWGGVLRYLFLWPQVKPLPQSPSQVQTFPSPRCATYDEATQRVLDDLKPPPFGVLAGTLLDVNTSERRLSFIAPGWKGPLEYDYSEEPQILFLDKEITDPQELTDLYPQIANREIVLGRISFSQFLSMQESPPWAPGMPLFSPRIVLLILKQKEGLVYEPMILISGE